MSTDIAQERLTRRIQELYASDPQFAAARFDEAVSAAIERPGLRLSLTGRLTTEQAALRRVATLVARGVEPSEVFDAVTNEMCRYVPADCAGLWRYETSGEITVVAAAYHPASAPAKWPVGTRTPIAGNILASMVQRTGRPARMDSYDNVAGSIAARARAMQACARRWGCRSSLMDACGAWRRSVRCDPARCLPTPRCASAASRN